MGEFKPPLPQGAGYAIILGLGAVFAVGMVMTTIMLRRYQKEVISAEEYSTAGRSVKTGLVAAAVVSSWIWSSTLLTSSAKQLDGMLGGYSYAAGACFQIVAFAILAIKTKQKAPNAHTYLEIMQKRYGKVAHCVYIFYALATNILVTAMLLTSGAEVFSQICGMNMYAACFLLPIGVVFYTLFGGIKATFLTDFVHTCVIIGIAMYFSFEVFAHSDILGSPGKVYDLVRVAAKRHPVSGNQDGEYMTMKSRSAGIFLVINLVGNFGTVFLDNGYWNKAISASPVAALPGYVIGGLSWFAIPSLLSVTMGFACLAVETLPTFPTFPDPLSAQQVSEGLVLPAAAITVMGKGGAVATLLMIFMAVTSAMSAELISVSSVFTYDIFKPYFKPTANSETLVFSSHIACIVFGVAMSAFSAGLCKAGISVGYLYELMGIIISSAVLPVVLSLVWRGQNKIAVIVTPILGTSLAIMSWLVSTKSLFKHLTLSTTFEDNPMLTGNVVALLSPCIFIPLLTYLFKLQDFDWERLKEIKRVDDTDELELSEQLSNSTVIIRKNSCSETDESMEFSIDDKKGIEPSTSVVSIADVVKQTINDDEKVLEEQELKRGLKVAYFLCVFFALAFLVVWPMPMYGSGYIFSKKFFTGWVVVMIIWIFISSFCVCFYPIWEGRHGIYTTFRGIYWDISGQSYKVRRWQESEHEQLDTSKEQTQTPF
ncbi:hypothetical protein TPHA_0G03610 [Tetrapisispora phaffii CBS 4417]|uniref:Urea active transporter n=1 Tax=Tetrapisispora phaffii (strain ATCC 24235 / CBS 4417 / NBRC 1672 / NRRL Y-8282 / UCD 70-5) TaxID=1071381 RepID=G8BWC3_TETPH|nr:hypothetical protein TPHA_0G03610 [Tetrapisispora phaffii CBS 4417]CCE64201.1 hypothetical protein TPHA_0G03610 [Tetrapisispora phaffii CBS 4417]